MTYEFLHPRHQQPRRYPRKNQVMRLSDHIMNVLTVPMTEADIKFALNTKSPIIDSLHRLEKNGKIKLVGEEWVKVQSL